MKLTLYVLAKLSQITISPPRYNFSNVEIEVFFSKYDIDGKFIYVPDDDEEEGGVSLLIFCYIS